MITIVLADDHHVVRQGLRSLLETEPQFCVTGEAGDGLEASRLVERLQPDVLVIDLMMPGMNGLEVAKTVRQTSPKTKVLILSMYDNESYVLEALRSGAAGYVLKGANSVELLKAVTYAAEGRRYLSLPFSDLAIEAYIQKAQGEPADLYDSLTRREREVLHLAADGCSNPEIGNRLYISSRTVEIHRASMMKKLRLRNQTDLIRFALKRGIVPLDENPNEQENIQSDDKATRNRRHGSRQVSKASK
jgi:two-component system, NarL family, response regulator NreC